MDIVADENNEEEKMCYPSIKKDTSNDKIQQGTLEKYLFSGSFNTSPNLVTQIKLNKQFEEGATQVNWEGELVSALNELKK